MKRELVELKTNASSREWFYRVRYSGHLSTVLIVDDPLAGRHFDWLVLYRLPHNTLWNIPLYLRSRKSKYRHRSLEEALQAAEDAIRELETGFTHRDEILVLAAWTALCVAALRSRRRQSTRAIYLQLVGLLATSAALFEMLCRERVRVNREDPPLD